MIGCSRLSPGVDEHGVGDALHDRGDAHAHPLADELGGVGDDDVDAVELADAGVRRRRARPRRACSSSSWPTSTGPGGRELLDRPLLEQAHVVEVDVGVADEEEAPLGHLLELLQPRAVGPDDERGDLRVQLDLERLRARARA